jgi:hypothetical protein
MRPIVELANDIEVPLFLIAGWVADDKKPLPFVVLPMPSMIAERPAMQLPMTLHQRLWNWPEEVGPINRAGTFPGRTTTPKELPTVDSGLSLPVMPKWPRGDDPLKATPTYADQDAFSIPVKEQMAFGLRSIWTDGHKTLPMMKPALYGVFNDGSNIRFTVSGITRDGSGVALGGCSVEALRVDKMHPAVRQENALVAETVSDGSGNFSLDVPANVAYMLIGYKVGSPDVAGVTVNVVQVVEA